MAISLFEKAINHDVINNLTAQQLNELDNMFTSNTKKAVKAKLKNGISPMDLTQQECMDYFEIRMNSVGWYCDTIDTTFYDLIDLASALVEHYESKGYELQRQIAANLEMYCLDDLDDY